MEEEAGESAALIEAAREGDERAVREIARLLRAFARHVCRGGGPAQLAGLDWEDVAQEASRMFFSVGIQRYQAGTTDRAYLYAHARNTYLQMARTARRRMRREEQSDPPGATSLDPERITLLARLLTRLPETCRHLLERLYFDGAGYAELALELGMAESSVRSRASRCLGRARELAS